LLEVQKKGLFSLVRGGADPPFYGRGDGINRLSVFLRRQGKRDAALLNKGGGALRPDESAYLYIQ